MTDPLTAFCIAAGTWGAYRKFIKHRVPEWRERVLDALLGPITEEDLAAAYERAGLTPPGYENVPAIPPAATGTTEKLVPVTSTPPESVAVDVHQWTMKPAGGQTNVYQPPVGYTDYTSEIAVLGADPAARVRKAVQALPDVVKLVDIMQKAGDSKLALPLGVDQTGKSRFLDFGDDTLNVAVYGGSGSGKDTIIMGWFMALTSRNTPDELQFIVLDGKGHWLTPNLRNRAHMVIDPCGGYGEKGTERIERGLDLIDAEAERRSELIFESGCRSREQYVEKTGERLPMIVVLITDGMDAIQGLIEERLISLASKGRALGFKVIVAMSTPTKRDMRWRINLSTVMSGPLQDRSQNAVALGLPTDSIIYPPSFLPNPQRRHGTFVVRLGGEQFVVQAPFTTNDEFDAYAAMMPQRPDNTDELLTDLLGSGETSARAPAAQARTRSKDGAVSEFIDACVEENEGGKVTGGVLYKAYVKYCEDMGYRPVNQTAFGTSAGDLLNKARSGRGVVTYLNIVLVDPNRVEE
jgi:hypothetical protein